MNEDELERGLRDAIAAETEPVRVDEYASLTAIRERAASARRRRLVGATALGAAAALVIGIAIGASVGGDDDHTNVAANGPRTTIGGDCASTTTSVISGPTTTVGPTTVIGRDGTTEPMTTMTDITAISSGDGCQDTVAPTTEPFTPSTPTTGTVPTTGPTHQVPLIVFPAVEPQDTAWPWPDPESTARAFLASIDAGDAALGPFQPADPSTAGLSLPAGTELGTITVHPRNGDGSARTDVVRSTLGLMRVDGHWVITGARSDSIEVDPAGVDLSPRSLTVAGKGRGFEGVLHVEVIGHGDAGFDQKTTAMASGDMDLRPFSVTVPIAGSSGQQVSVIVSNESGETGGPGDITAYSFLIP